MNDRVSNNLATAIRTMREACDDAERESREADDRAVRRVIHLLTWGLANATSSIECAMDALEDARAIALAKALENARRGALDSSGER